MRAKIRKLLILILVFLVDFFLMKLSIKLGRLSKKAIMFSAIRDIGSLDRDDRNIEVPLGILVNCINEGLNLEGRIICKRIMTRWIKDRLEIKNTLKLDPEILRVPIKRPICIVALPRTGTTMLQSLLAQDPNNRAPLTWEVYFPLPPPDPPTYETDPRIKEAQRIFDQRDQSKHLKKACTPMETWPFLARSWMMPFASVPLFPVGFEPYWEFLISLSKDEMVPVFQFHKRQVQILQRHFPSKRWILKTPFYTLFIEGLIDVFPDACLINVFRDPLEIVPSHCSLLYYAIRTIFHELNPEEIGVPICQKLAIISKQLMKARESLPASQFFDVKYEELIRSPVETVRKIYAHFGFEMNDEFVEKMKQWLVENPQHKYSVHEYRLEQYGLDAHFVNGQFAKYKAAMKRK